MSPWEPHRFDLVEPGGACLCLVLYIKPIWFLETSDSTQHPLSFSRSEISMTTEVSRAVRRLIALLVEADNLDLFDSYLYETELLCYNQSWFGRECGTAIDFIADRFTDFRVRRSLRIMQERFIGDLEMEQFDREAGLSRPHFFNLFKRQTGVTPNVYLNTLRAEQVIQDLMTTEKTVTEISHDLGFSSQASFTRFFASNVGIPPSRYRRVTHVS